MAALHWGFKSRANEIAREKRRELNLGTADRLDPWRLAEHLCIPIVPLSRFAEADREAIIQLTKRDKSAFSAATIFHGHHRMIIVNDAHSRGRRASSIAHELAHVILWHKPQNAPQNGVRHWDPVQEAEAHWLGGALLISDEAAVRIVRQGMTLAEAAEAYGVSTDMVTFRTKVTGARKRVERARAFRRRNALRAEGGTQSPSTRRA